MLRIRVEDGGIGVDREKEDKPMRGEGKRIERGSEIKGDEDSLQL